MTELSSQKVSFGEKVGYSLGDVAANLVFQIMMIFQLKFYTDVFGLEGAVAGSVFLIACLFGAFFDPLVGVGENIAHGCCGQHSRSVSFISLPSTTQVLRKKVWWRCMLLSPISY